MNQSILAFLCVAAAALYLARGWVAEIRQHLRPSAKGCAGNCGCSAAQPSPPRPAGKPSRSLPVLR
ncbi:MAG: hypothetical protein K1Y36_23855 [Blastocatellia bacterium]|nr:hypothetical protein [Blastocatellia bacterium]